MSEFLKQLMTIAALAETKGEAAIAAGNDPLACLMFRAMESADALFLALKDCEDAEQLELAA